ncbi:hypothetical protein ACA910_002360 [Epithemia clementina (nom. ined.)]
MSLATLCTGSGSTMMKKKERRQSLSSTSILSSSNNHVTKKTTATPSRRSFLQKLTSSSKSIATSTTWSTAGGVQKNVVPTKIVDIQVLTSDIKLVTLKIVKGHAFTFHAGQFTGVYDGRNPKHMDPNHTIFPGTFSIVSPPCALPYVSFAIGKDHNPRNLRHFLYHDAKIGHGIFLDSTGSGTVAITPRMVMTPVGGPGGLLLIGGGSAVMGLVSIVEELLQDAEGQKIPCLTLLHSNRSNQDIPFYDRMKELEQRYPQFHYQPYITGPIAAGETPRGTPGRITVRDLAQVLSGVRLYAVCGSGVFCESMVNALLDLGVWPGSIRTDYTTRVDPARRLHQLEATTKDHSDEEASETEESSESESNGSSDLIISKEQMTLVRAKSASSSSLRRSDLMQRRASSRRFEACADATQEKGSMAATDGEYLKTYGIDQLWNHISTKLVEEKPEFPLQFIHEQIAKAKENLPEVSNANAGDPDFWINYWETDKVTWQAPVTSPWLHKYLDEFLPTPKQTVFVPLCGKTLDMKLLLDAGHHVVGAECSGIACVDFFTENHIPGYAREELTTVQGQRVVRHRSTVQPIELYECDIFDLTPAITGRIDAVLDRAALVALPPSIIEDQYLPLLTRLLRPGGAMLFASVSELPFAKAPPHAYKRHQIEGLLQKFFAKIQLKEVHRYRVNAGHVSEPVYLLQSKTFTNASTTTAMAATVSGKTALTRKSTAAAATTALTTTAKTQSSKTLLLSSGSAPNTTTRSTISDGGGATTTTQASTKTKTAMTTTKKNTMPNTGTKTPPSSNKTMKNYTKPNKPTTTATTIQSKTNKTKKTTKTNKKPTTTTTTSVVVSIDA